MMDFFKKFLPRDAAQYRIFIKYTVHAALCILGVFVLKFAWSWGNDYITYLKVKPYIDEANQKSDEAVRQVEVDLHAFFQNAKRGAPALADDALSFGTKIKAIDDAISGTHQVERYITQRFSVLIFSTDSLQKELESILINYAQEIESIENEMLINIQQDVSDLPPDSLIEKTAPQDLAETFASMMNPISKTTSRDLPQSIIRLGLSLVGEAILVDLATSTGLLTGGAVLSFETLGISWFASILVDWAIKSITQPEKKIINTVNQQIDQTENRILYGDGDKNEGLRAKLLKFNQDRAKIRKKTIRKMIRSNSGSTT